LKPHARLRRRSRRRAVLALAVLALVPRALRPLVLDGDRLGTDILPGRASEG
jgi:hypothetical protein